MMKIVNKILRARNPRKPYVLPSQRREGDSIYVGETLNLSKLLFIQGHI